MIRSETAAAVQGLLVEDFACCRFRDGLDSSPLCLWGLGLPTSSLSISLKAGKADNSELGSFAMFDGGRGLSLFDESRPEPKPRYPKDIPRPLDSCDPAQIWRRGEP